MRPSEPAPAVGEGRRGAAAGDVVLNVGDAVAVLLVEPAAGRDQRIAAAQSALIAATGRLDIRIGQRPSGRPRLDPPFPELAVSLSHRGDLLLSGFSPTADVGVDLEPATDELDAVRLARDHYRPLEAARIARLEASAARDVFLRMWVVKEAALKVTGRGVFDGLDEPDLAEVSDVLAGGHDGSALVSLRLPASSRLPAISAAMRRIALDDGRRVYCALAVRA